MKLHIIFLITFAMKTNASVLISNKFFQSTHYILEIFIGKESLKSSCWNTEGCIFSGVLSVKPSGAKGGLLIDMREVITRPWMSFRGWKAGRYGWKAQDVCSTDVFLASYQSSWAFFVCQHRLDVCNILLQVCLQSPKANLSTS